MDTLEKIARTLDPEAWSKADEHIALHATVPDTAYDLLHKSLAQAEAVLQIVPDYEGMVKEFHEAFGHPVGGKPALIDPDRAKARAKWMREEITELVDKGVIPGDLVEVYDAIGDELYFAFGTAIEYGPGVIGAIFTVIHRSNMSKLGEDGKPQYREDGKVLKGPGYFEPTESIKAILDGAIDG